MLIVQHVHVHAEHDAMGAPHSCPTATTSSALRTSSFAMVVPCTHANRDERVGTSTASVGRRSDAGAVRSSSRSVATIRMAALA